MNDPTPPTRPATVRDLELHKETLQELTEGEAEDAHGGGRAAVVTAGCDAVLTPGNLRQNSAVCATNLCATENCNSGACTP